MKTMKFKYENIIFEYIREDVGYELGLVGRDKGIGFPRFDIPLNHILRMFEDGYYWEDKDHKLLPHTYLDDLERYSNYNKDEIPETLEYRDCIDCCNTDLFIVYLEWLLKQEEEFIIEVASQSPYWIFHDIAHTKDVWSGEVDGINGHVEECRLREGVELMKVAKVKEEFTEYYVSLLHESFYRRWKFHLDRSIFSPMIAEEEYE